MPRSRIAKARVLDSDADRVRSIQTALEGVDTEPLLVTGPGTAPTRDTAAFALCASQAALVDALEGGAIGAMLWPGDPAELRARIQAAATRHRDLVVDRADFEALVSVSEALSVANDIDRTLFNIAQQLSAVMDSDRCSIILLDEQGEHGVVVADSTDPNAHEHPIDVKTKYPEIEAVTRTRAPLVVHDVGSAPLFDRVRNLIADKPVGNTALFPVRLGNRVPGVILLRGRGVRREGLTDRQLRFGSIVSNATSLIVRNARIYRSMKARTNRVMSARLRAERRLRQLEKYRRFFDLAGDGLAIIDTTGRFIFANQAAKETLGFQENEITRLTLHDIVAPSGQEGLRDLLNGFGIGDHRRQIDLPVIHAAGTTLLLSLSTAPLAPDGAPVSADSASLDWRNVAAIVSMRDVTEQRRTQNKLQETNTFLESVIGASPDGILAYGPDGTIIVFNPSAERLTGYRRANVVGKRRFDALCSETIAETIRRRLRSPKWGGVGAYRAGRQSLVAKDGSLVPTSLVAAEVSVDSQVVATLVVFSDRRYRIELEEKLSHAQRRLEISERQEGMLELAGTAAHALSQPLTTILGSAELVARRLPTTSRERQRTELIVDECQRMADILKKISQITKYETEPYMPGTNILDLDAAAGQKTEQL